MWWNRRRDIGPPFDPRAIDRIRAAAIRNRQVDLAHSVRWLMDRNDTDHIAESVRTAWRSSTLPLRELASQILSVNVWVPESRDDLRLQVRLSGTPERTLFQDTPLRRDVLDGYVRAFPSPVPPICQQVALSAPGLSHDSDSRLLPHQCFHRRLGAVLEWVSRALDARSKQHGQPRLPCDLPSRCLMEIGIDSSDNWLLLGMDGLLWFWDHEEVVSLQRCAVSLQDLINRCIERAGTLDDDAFLGVDDLAVTIVPRSDSLEPESGLTRLRRVVAQLTSLACIALAVRACQRERSLAEQRGVPSWWKQHLVRLDETIELCRSVSTSGQPLEPRQVKQIEQAIDQACQAWWVKVKGFPSDIYPYSLFASKVGVLVKAAASLASIEQVRPRVVGCGEGVTANRDIWWPTVFADFEQLLSLSLGQAGTLGKPVPADFYARPLW